MFGSILSRSMSIALSTAPCAGGVSAAERRGAWETRLHRPLLQRYEGDAVCDAAHEGLGRPVHGGAGLGHRFFQAGFSSPEVVAQLCLHF
jgi:hypothetical protein